MNTVGDTGHLVVMLAGVVREHGHRTATRARVGDGWRTATYAEFWADIQRVAAALVAAGVQRGDRVGILSPNVPEWSVADFAILAAGAISVPLYATSTSDEVRHVLSDSGCVGVFVAGQSELDRVLAAGVPGVRFLVSFAEVAPGDDRVRMLADLPAPTTATQAELAARMSVARADDLASIIYTSGTTGVPRGVMLTHRGFSFQIDVLNQFFDITPDDHSLCFLPLSHALERAWTYHVLSNGCMNTYWAEPRTVAQGLVRAQPTLLVSVPRLYEKVFTVAQDRVAKAPSKKRIFDWALGVGRRLQAAHRAGRRAPWWVRVQLPLADKLVLSSVRQAIGGPKKVLACGGAPLRTDVQEFFSACGVQLLSGYGLTEASPLVSFDSPTAWKIGASGRVVIGGEIRTTDAGEVCYRGPNVMAGYWNMPDETAAALREGWLYTGDVGHIDDEGFLVITDRIKDLIVTSNGKNVAPAAIEGLVLQNPLFEYAMALGDNRPYLTLLVSPSIPNLEELGRQLAIKWEHRDELLRHPEIVKEIKRRVDKLTERLAQHERIKDVRVVADEFSTDSGLLTPTLKVKRKEVERRFKEVIDDMYSKLSRKPE